MLDYHDHSVLRGEYSGELEKGREKNRGQRKKKKLLETNQTPGQKKYWYGKGMTCVGESPYKKGGMVDTQVKDPGQSKKVFLHRKNSEKRFGQEDTNKGGPEPFHTWG